jgi:hypothetical protein
VVLIKPRSIFFVVFGVLIIVSLIFILRKPTTSIAGSVVSTEELEKVYEKLPEAVKANMTKEEVAVKLSKEKAVLAEAKKEAVNTTDEEVDTFITALQQQNSLDSAQFEERVAAMGYTPEEYREKIKELIVSSKFLNEKLDLQNVSVSNKEIDDYMAENKQEFDDVIKEGGPELEAQIRERVRLMLVQKKQDELVQTYMDSIKVTS